MVEEKKEMAIDGGCGPAFQVEDLPEPPRDLTPRKLFAMLGPAVIALGGTIGGGEWLVGPSLFVKWGLALLWITTISALLQVFLNLEMTRYTLYTGDGFLPLLDSASGAYQDGSSARQPLWLLFSWVKFPESQIRERSSYGVLYYLSHVPSLFRWGGKSNGPSNGPTGL
jgi:hypothetical protein